MITAQDIVNQAYEEMSLHLPLDIQVEQIKLSLQLLLLQCRQQTMQSSTALLS